MCLQVIATIGPGSASRPFVEDFTAAYVAQGPGGNVSQGFLASFSQHAILTAVNAAMAETSRRRDQKMTGSQGAVVKRVVIQ